MVPDLGSPRGFVGSVLASYVPRQEKPLCHGGRFLGRGRESPGPIFPESGWPPVRPDCGGMRDRQAI